MVKRVKTIDEFHRLRGLSKPEHPLISVVKVQNARHLHTDETELLVLDFYVIALKRVLNKSRLKYGQQEYDFNEGIMSFISPNQVFGIVADSKQEVKQSGWVLLIHPDFLWHTPLANTIRTYDFFDYSVTEALFLSEKEELTILGIIEAIQREYQSTIDTFSQDILIAHVETLLRYADRFYHRQFLTRRKANHQILQSLETLLTAYFDSDDLSIKGLPSVQSISGQLNVSVSYLSRLLKTLTGQTTQQHIHDKLIEKAKEKLSTTELSVSEIAYELGFGHSQSFSKFFKTKTAQSPLAFRQSFN
ncbi:AraC family transcriptional regulator [Spirosoma sp. KNUC1025]|uniref:helix-turn-helix domain-containing protein n=1 Tax=Spirosoma sp. KNUC1025 TaxID=2894082 RepID=UPI001E4AF0EC|nr:response regulator transcription factor [Spirosoma sp. KNUC1025]UFH57789.1 helix-turn-helix transcriptional regulator [Spirosoma sp. KNUC1025]